MYSSSYSAISSSHSETAVFLIVFLHARNFLFWSFQGIQSSCHLWCPNLYQVYLSSPYALSYCLVLDSHSLACSFHFPFLLRHLNRCRNVFHSNCFSYVSLTSSGWSAIWPKTYCPLSNHTLPSFPTLDTFHFVHLLFHSIVFLILNLHLALSFCFCSIVIVFSSFLATKDLYELYCPSREIHFPKQFWRYQPLLASFYLCCCTWLNTSNLKTLDNLFRDLIHLQLSVSNSSITKTHANLWSIVLCFSLYSPSWRSSLLCFN